MKKFILPLFLLILTSHLLFLNIGPVSALDPTIIDRADYGPPPPQSSGDDINFHPNDIFNTPVTDCPGQITISQSFDPNQIGTSNGQPIYEPYDVNQIQGILDFNRIYNKGPERQNMHEAYRNKYTDDASTDEAFRSFDVNKPIGASNLADRSTPYAVLKCQKGQRLVLAVNSLYPNFNGTITNEQIAWNCGGAIYTVQQKKNGSGCTPIRLADIANALASQLIFYNPSADCYTYPDATTLPKSVPQPNPVSVDSAALLLKNNVEVIENGSLTRGITICDTNNPSDCQYKKHQVPLGAVQATYQNTVKQIIPKSEDLRSVDLCQTSSRPISLNKPNPLSFLVIIKEFFGTIVDSARTFTGTAKIDYLIDDRVDLNRDETFLNNLLPKAEQDKYQTTTQPGSSTEGQDYDPGAPITRSVFAKNLLPMNF